MPDQKETVPLNDGTHSREPSGSRSLHTQHHPDAKLYEWAEQLLEYEEPFPRYDAQGQAIEASYEEIVQTVAQWYVRKNNKYYDVDVPGEVLSRDDVERVIIQRLIAEFPANRIPQDVVRQILQRVIRDTFVSPRQSIPIWSGIRKSYPGNPARLIFSKHMTATINTWRQPAYRQKGITRKDWGPFEEFLDFIFPREDEQAMIVNWLAWCLQNEGDKPGWAPFLFSSTKGSGKSTLAAVCAKLFGEENSSTENNVSKLVSRFNAPVLQNKFVICEELNIQPGSDRANAVKTFITEKHTMTEHKGHDVQTVEQMCAFMFTSNHQPFWLEQGDRRFYVVEIDHDGHRRGPRANEFSKLVTALLTHLEAPEHLAELYNALMSHRVPATFDAKSLDVQGSSTRIMQTIQGASWDIEQELFAAELSRIKLVALPAALMNLVAEDFGKPSHNRIKHWLINLGWERHNLKWGGADYRRVIFLRSGYKMSAGTIYGPDRWAMEVADGKTLSDFARKDISFDDDSAH